MDSLTSVPHPLAGLVRPARPDEAASLSALALRSKAHWGYDAAFLAACERVLRLTPEQLEADLFFVLEQDGQALGFYGLRVQGEEAELTDLWLEPRAIGQGHGRRLWQHAVATARSRGCRQLRLEADPFAEPFYLAMGAERIGEVASTVRAGRMLPLMHLRL